MASTSASAGGSGGWDALLARCGVRRAVLMTAWNPRSRLRPEGWNRRAQRLLLHRARHALAYGSSGEGRWHEEQVLLRADGRLRFAHYGAISYI